MRRTRELYLVDARHVVARDDEVIALFALRLRQSRRA